jgi:hypothetical protein
MRAVDGYSCNFSVEKTPIFLYNKDMFIVGFLGWWYGAGWRARMVQVGERLLRMFDYFSLDLLIKTWFSPFRQIGTEEAQPGLGGQMRAFFDRLVSRSIGGMVRTVMMIAGVIVLAVVAVAGLVEAVLWLFVPLFPIVGGIMFATGWVPDVRL